MEGNGNIRGVFIEEMQLKKSSEGWYSEQWCPRGTTENLDQSAKTVVSLGHFLLEIMLAHLIPLQLLLSVATSEKGTDGVFWSHLVRRNLQPALLPLTVPGSLFRFWVGRCHSFRRATHPSHPP
jgi:hypothetical protein